MQRTISFAVALCFLASVLHAEPTIWLIGDSTVADYPPERAPVAGWGQMLSEHCIAGVEVKNRAVSGTTTRSFVTRKFWEKTLPELQEGDFLFIQFGHNDHYKERGQHLVSADDYKRNLAAYIKQVREKGATPILVTPMCRRIFGENGKIKKSFDNYPEKVTELAQETNTAVVDLYDISFREFGKMTKEETEGIFLYLPAGMYPAFPDGKKDGVHFQFNGARRLAEWVVRDAKKQKLPVAEFFQ